jgi:hypothetical protein
VIENLKEAALRALGVNNRANNFSTPTGGLDRKWKN